VSNKPFYRLSKQKVGSPLCNSLLTSQYHERISSKIGEGYCVAIEALDEVRVRYQYSIERTIIRPSSIASPEITQTTYLVTDTFDKSVLAKQIVYRLIPYPNTWAS